MASKVQGEMAACAECTESETMVMFGWTDPKMPARYIAQANREKLGVNGMDKVVAFDRSQSLDDVLQPTEGNKTGTTNGERSGISRAAFEKV